MKNLSLKTLAAIALMLIVCASAKADKDKPIDVSQLPETAQTTLKTYFSDRKIALAKVESGVFEKNYDVIFTNGDKIEFDKHGKWTEIQCKQSAVPSGLVPQKIAGYVNTNYAGCKIMEIERDGKEYEVKLSNGIELTFNTKFQLIDID